MILKTSSGILFKARTSIWSPLVYLPEDFSSSVISSWTCKVLFFSLSLFLQNDYNLKGFISRLLFSQNLTLKYPLLKFIQSKNYETKAIPQNEKPKSWEASLKNFVNIAQLGRLFQKIRQTEGSSQPERNGLTTFFSSINMLNIQHDWYLC